MTNTFSFDRKQKNYDGETVADALDYYVPEWRRKTGRPMLLVKGETVSGKDYDVYVNALRSNIVRHHGTSSDHRETITTLFLNDPKIWIITLFQYGDVVKEMDKRYAILLDDFRRK